MSELLTYTTRMYMEFDFYEYIYLVKLRHFAVLLSYHCFCDLDPSSLY